jgi:hypothetical protein
VLLAKPAVRPQEKARLEPSRLFSNSPRGSLIRENPRVKRQILFAGQHRIYFDVGNGCGVENPDVTPRIEGVPGIQISKSTGICTQNRWYYHSNSLVNTVDDCTHKWFREFLVHGTVWTGVCDNAVHRSQRLEVKPLKSSDWPRDPLGPSWPSFPSIPEWMEMLRKGLDPFCRRALMQPAGNLGFTQVSRREIHENHVLATLIVRQQVVGVRSSVEIPRKFLSYFRYRQNFLILTCTYAIPIGLVRFLLGRWITAPYSLWLRRAVSFKIFLKKVPTSLVSRARLRCVQGDPRSPDTRAGSCTPSESDPSEFDSDELD